jgi:hypothetical protein
MDLGFHRRPAATDFNPVKRAGGRWFSPGGDRRLQTLDRWWARISPCGRGARPISVAWPLAAGRGLSWVISLPWARGAWRTTKPFLFMHFHTS